jgi:hypothetical protein
LLVLAHQSGTINQAMKRVPPKVKKKSKAKKSAAIRSFRGKYKHLDLMQELTKFRKEDRQLIGGHGPTYQCG